MFSNIAVHSRYNSKIYFSEENMLFWKLKALALQTHFRNGLKNLNVLLITSLWVKVKLEHALESTDRTHAGTPEVLGHPIKWDAEGRVQLIPKISVTFKGLLIKDVSKTSLERNSINTVSLVLYQAKVPNISQVTELINQEGSRGLEFVVLHVTMKHQHQGTWKIQRKWITGRQGKAR